MKMKMMTVMMMSYDDDSGTAKEMQMRQENSVEMEVQEMRRWSGCRESYLIVNKLPDTLPQRDHARYSKIDLSYHT